MSVPPHFQNIMDFWKGWYQAFSCQYLTSFVNYLCQNSRHLRLCSVTYSNLALQVNMNIMKPSQIECLTNNICLPFWQIQRATLVGFMYTSLKLVRNIIVVVSRSANRNNVTVLVLGKCIWMLVPEF